MANAEKTPKMCKQLRAKAQEFIANRKKVAILEELVNHFGSGQDTASCLLALELIFTTLLKEGDMFLEVVPLKPAENTKENEFKLGLQNIYSEIFDKILVCFENESSKMQTQALSTAMNILAVEGKHPLEKTNSECFVPIIKLKGVLMKLLSGEKNNAHLINKYTEYLLFDDILFFTWKCLPNLTSKSKPPEIYIANYLALLEKLQVYQNTERKLMCSSTKDANFAFDENANIKILNRIWGCVMIWNHTEVTHKQLLIVLLERVLTHLKKPLYLTDFLMDSLDVGGPVSLLALQGIFTMIQVHNLYYPDIFTKLYSMFEPEIFHTKFKARLFYLSDMFLSSTHLPESLVAAFAKRFARLALVAPSEDIIIICMFIGNLILRHPGLKTLLHHVSDCNPSEDPYQMEESDPAKSNALQSCLWEIATLQNHTLPSVASAASFINSPLPSVEWDLSKVLENTCNDIFDKEIKRCTKLVVLAFEKPNGFALSSKNEKLTNYWNF